MADIGAFDDMKVELIEGEIHRMPPPGSRHGQRQAMLLIRLASVAEEALLRGAVAIDLGDATVVGVDAALLVTALDVSRALLPHEILLAVEVAEITADRDLGMKRLRYAAAEIPYYWVVDGERSVIHVYGVPLQGDYKQLIVVPFGEPLSVPGTDGTIVIE